MHSKKVKIEIIDYSEKGFEEKETDNVDECFPFKKTPTVTWVNVIGLHDMSVIEGIGKHFDFHPLTIEDITITDQRPKIEYFDDYFLLILKMIRYRKNSEINVEQVSMIVGKNFVISFQEKESDVFNRIKNAIRTGKGRIRKSATDYLAYCIMDVLIDNYFVVLEKIGEDIEEMEEKIIEDPSPEALNFFHKVKKDLISLRKSVWPLREVISSLRRGESKLIKKNTAIYLRDLYDHTIELMDTVKSLRDIVSSMLDVYLSITSNKLNEVMKVLTVIATIFIPLTFITGVYGMNFKYMFELEWPLGYYVVWAVMISMAVTMFAYFKKKKWI